MKIEQKNSQNEIIIKIPKNKIQKEHENKITDMSKSLKLKGFRPGFVPKHIIKSRFGNNIYQETLSKLLNEELLDYIKKEKLDIIDHPKLKKISENNEEYVECILEFYLFPKINLNLTNIEIKEYKSDITNDDINNEINKLRLNHGIWKVTSTSSKFNDILNINLYEKIDKNFQYMLKDEQIKIDNEFFHIKNLKTQLNDKINNKEYIIYIKNNEIKNQVDSDTKTIYLTINEIKRKYPIDINDDFMEKIGFKKADKTQLNDLIKEQLLTVSNYISNKIKKYNIFKSLTDSHKFEIPDILIEKKLNEKNLKKTKQDIIKDIKINLILLAIKNKFNINISKMEIINHAQSLYGKNDKKFDLEDRKSVV